MLIIRIGGRIPEGRKRSPALTNFEIDLGFFVKFHGNQFSMFLYLKYFKLKFFSVIHVKLNQELKAIS